MMRPYPSCGSSPISSPVFSFRYLTSLLSALVVSGSRLTPIKFRVRDDWGAAVIPESNMTRVAPRAANLVLEGERIFIFTPNSWPKDFGLIWLDRFDPLQF